MVHADSTIPSLSLKQWLESPESMLENAEFWVSAGSREHWQWSLMYAQKYERGYTYWGLQIDSDQSQKIFEKEVEEVKGVRVPKLLQEMFQRREKPNIVFFYVSKGIGVIGAGLVVDCEYDFFNLFWPEERRNNRIIYPFRYKMRILWLHESVFSERWVGDPELSGLLKDYSISGLQHVAKVEVVRRLREILKNRLSQPLRISMQPMRTSWLDRLSVEELEKVLQGKGLIFDKNVLSKLVAALKGGKHVILVGPPGTGKTILARTLAETYGVPLVDKTATSEWSRVDVVGGPIFIGGEVIWKCGALMEAIARCHESERGAILLIDEINRANLDRAFGEFFTIFGSSDPKEWKVPESLIHEIRTYQMKGKIDEFGQLLLQKYTNDRELKVPENLRVIATMNLYDRRYLFTLGYALLRRFAIIEVGNPDPSGLQKLLEERCGDSRVAERIRRVYEELKNAGLELGVAILIDVAKIAAELKKQGHDEAKALDSAIAMTIIPQLEGLSPAILENCRNVFEKFKFETSLNTFNSFFGRELNEMIELRK